MEIDREAITQTFLAESEEHLREMEEALVALENNPENQETLQIIFRVVHTIKGNASCLGFADLTKFAHVLEDLLDQLRKQQIPVIASLITLLLQSVDALREIIPDAASGNDELQQAHLSLLNHLTTYVSPTSETAPSNDLQEIEQIADSPTKSTHAGGRSSTLRIDIEKLDRLLNITGEMAIARERIRKMLEDLHGMIGEDIAEARREEDRLYMDLQELVMNVRMVPVGPTFRQFSRTVRDLATSHGKSARLTIEGAEVEVDTSVIELLKDPLTHMIRNALDHGIELPDVRKRLGKDPYGQLTLRAYHDAGSIVIQLADDGAGFNRKRIIEKAREKGLAAEPEKMTDREVYRLVFESGFSTAEAVTDLSGRGVGMDVVRRNIESLRGNMDIETQPGRGTTLTIRLPLTVAIIDGFSVGVAGEAFVIPLGSVVECLEMPVEERQHADTCGVINLRGNVLPYVRLGKLFELGASDVHRENIVVVEHGEERAGLAVDTLYGESQTVIKPLSKLFKGLPGISGSAILGNGRVAIVLDVPTLIKKVIEREAAQSVAVTE